jgi:hypothetical protein
VTEINDREREQLGRNTVAWLLAGPTGVDHSPTTRAAHYPLGPATPLSLHLLVGVARAMADAGWPAVRHPQDWERLAQALRWVASGGPATHPRPGRWSRCR